MTPRHLHLAHPLPECAMCEQPVRRDTHTANGGLCTSCAEGIAELNRVLAERNTLRPLFPIEDR